MSIATSMKAESGQNLKIIGSPIDEMFRFDQYGSLIASVDNLQVDAVAEKMRAELRDNSDLDRALARRTYSTDVEFADRPLGSTPVIAYGVKLFGPSPSSGLRFKGRVEALSGSRDQSDYVKRSAKRNRSIESWFEKVRALTHSLKTESEQQEVLKEIEELQVMTGGGYDNTKAFGVTRNSLDFLNKSAHSIDFENTWRSEMLMKEILSFREELWKQLGVPLGSLQIPSLQVVRFLQESDGMMGWPAYAKARVPLTKTTAERISRNSGVSVMSLVKKDVTDPNTGEVHQAYVIDAVCYALDRMVVRATDLPAIITTLARIQRHGYKEEDGALHAKDGKARSVAPNATLSGAQEAMAFQPFLNICKEKRVPWLPSLQDQPTRDKMIKDWYINELVPKQYRVLAADWSGYDKTVNGSILATIIYYIIRPLYHASAQQWIDLAICSLVYKYFIVSKTAGKVNEDLYSEVLKSLPWAEINDEFIIVGTVNGLPSGAKLTHVGGSLYGELLIHHCIPRQLGWEPVSGPQAGDDTSLGTPLSFMHLDSVEETYQPISDAAAEWGLELNVNKQMWVVREGEPVNIFLQYAYHHNLEIWGIGTASRYFAALPFAERDKGLSLSEQYFAVLSKANNGYNNPFVREFIRDWLSEDDFACALFKEYGVSAFNVLVEHIGESVQDITKRLDLEYNWGISTDQLMSGDIPVLPIIAEVASRLSPKMGIREALKMLGDVEQESENVVADDPDTGESDDFDDEFDVEF